jgi:hypothetical protein
MRADAWLLAAVTEGSHDGRPVKLWELLHDFDYLNRALPTFDELSFGIPRLMAASLVTYDDGRFRATRRAIEIRRSLRADRLADVSDGMAAALGARRYPLPEGPEDRSLGRLAGLERGDLDAAIEQHGASFSRWTRPLVWAGTVLGRTLAAVDRIRRK